LHQIKCKLPISSIGKKLNYLKNLDFLAYPSGRLYAAGLRKPGDCGPKPTPAPADALVK
jgi:hypothetical protein